MFPTDEGPEVLFGERKPSYWASVVKLVTHFLGCGVIFVSLITIAWIISYFLSVLNSVHRFTDDLLTTIGYLEIAFVWTDILISAFFIAVGLIRFAKDVWGHS